MISARLLLILHKYAGIYMGASAQAAAPWRPKNWDRARLVRAGLGRAGLGSWAEPGASLRAYGANNFCPQLTARADWKFRAWKISSKLSASNRKCINIFSFLLFFFYIELLALILMNLRDFHTLFYMQDTVKTRENATSILGRLYNDLISRKKCHCIMSEQCQWWNGIVKDGGESISKYSKINV